MWFHGGDTGIFLCQQRWEGNELRTYASARLYVGFWQVYRNAKDIEDVLAGKVCGMNLKKQLSKYYYNHVYETAIGCRLRRFIESNPIAELRPFNKRASISDLFVWRCDDEWETEFDLFNISSFVYPDEQPQEECRIILFDKDGQRIGSHSITLAPFERRVLRMSDYLGSERGFGTFAVFHHSICASHYEAYKTHLTERGYIGYRRKGDVLKSFCHGNLQALSQGSEQQDFSYVAATTVPMRYHPQLILSDSPMIELIYTNPSARSRALSINLFDKDSRKVGERHVIIPARSVRIIKIDNAEKRIHTFDNVGGIVMWRPIIKKYYGTHFDVMHG